MTILSPNQIATVMRQAGWPEAAVATAVAVALAESGGNTQAINTANANGSYDYGLMQINSIHGYSPSLLLSDPVYNAKAGLSIFKAAGYRFTPWAAYNSGSYLKFMNNATAGATGTYAPSTLSEWEPERGPEYAWMGFQHAPTPGAAPVFGAFWYGAEPRLDTADGDGSGLQMPAGVWPATLGLAWTGLFYNAQPLPVGFTPGAVRIDAQAWVADGAFQRSPGLPADYFGLDGEVYGNLQPVGDGAGSDFWSAVSFTNVDARTHSGGTVEPTSGFELANLSGAGWVTVSSRLNPAYFTESFIGPLVQGLTTTNIAVHVKPGVAFEGIWPQSRISMVRLVFEPEGATVYNFPRAVCEPEAHRSGTLAQAAVVRPGGGSDVPGVDTVIDGVNVVDKAMAPYCVRDSVEFEPVLS